MGPGGVIVFVALLVLKLTAVKDMSWWLVFAPFWIPVAVVLLTIGIIAAIAARRR
jgi:hypothetical protein